MQKRDKDGKYMWNLCLAQRQEICSQCFFVVLCCCCPKHIYIEKSFIHVNVFHSMLIRDFFCPNQTLNNSKRSTTHFKHKIPPAIQFQYTFRLVIATWNYGTYTHIQPYTQTQTPNPSTTNTNDNVSAQAKIGILQGIINMCAFCFVIYKMMGQYKS